MHYRYTVICFILLLTQIYVFGNTAIYDYKTIICDSFKHRLNEQEQAVKQLIIRLLGSKQSNFFDIRVEGLNECNTIDSFKIKKTGEKLIQITGTTGVSATYGFHYYLKKYCKCHISWDSDQLALPETFPDIDVTVSSTSFLRYYQNVCTLSYSFVWWNWTRWEREIDWMILNGINFPLAFAGQEIIWKRVYEKFNLTKKDINEYFTGPAFLSWGRMGNIRKWGGPLSVQWHTRSLELQHKILHRMREFGIVPILPCFSGHVPKAFKRIFPNSSMSPLTKWANFPDEYCCPYILDPLDPLFKTVGTAFMQELISEFGTNHVYQCDMFNEMIPQVSDNDYLHKVSSTVFQTMINTDPNAVWVMQGWMFLDEALFWTPEKAYALLSAIPDNRLIILDLQSEFLPQYFRLHFYFGKPFIWCMLHNFGGTLGMHGSSDIINNRVHEARQAPNSTMVGIGLAPEGINQNYVIYDLMLEMAWNSHPVNLDNWFVDYSERRYGIKNTNLETAWKLLRNSVYNYRLLRKLRGQYTVCVRPHLYIDPWIWYNVNDVILSWDLFLNASKTPMVKESYLFKLDTVDLTRQIMQLYFDGAYKVVIKSFQEKNFEKLAETSEIIRNLIADLELILSTDSHFMLGIWLTNARLAGSDELEMDLFDMNARNQITLWGPNGEILDYATKQWSGVVIDYYYPRWLLFLNYLNNSLVSEEPFNQTQFNIDVFNHIERPFSFSKKLYSTIPVEDTIEAASLIYRRWRNKTYLLDVLSVIDQNIAINNSNNIFCIVLCVLTLNVITCVIY